MKIEKYTWWAVLALLLIVSPTEKVSFAWFDETHLAIAKVAGYHKWYNAAGADIAKLKMGEKEGHNHFVNNPRGTIVTPEMVFSQVDKYNQYDPSGHLYGAIIASVRGYVDFKNKGRYAEYHLAYASHYIGDLSQPLHHTLYNDFNRRNHSKMDGIVNDGVLDNLDKIEVYPIDIKTEQDLIREIVRIANLSLELGYKLEDAGRLLTREETYQQLSHSASLMKAVLVYLEKIVGK